MPKSTPATTCTTCRHFSSSFLAGDDVGNDEYVPARCALGHLVETEDGEERFCTNCTDWKRTPTAPHRLDGFAAWLKARRDAAEEPAEHAVIDSLLDLYRLHADTGTPLHWHVCEGRGCSGCADPA